MGRAQGKHPPRRPELSRAQDAEYGIEPGRHVPGGEIHVTNKQVIREQVPTGEPLAPFRGMMAHGVPPEHGLVDRDDPAGGRKPEVPSYADLPKSRPAIPVYIVEEAGGPRPLRSAAPYNVTLDADTGEARRLCGKDPARKAVLLLNEDSSHDARIGQRIADVEGGGGALLKAGATSYLRLATQDELWAISADTGTPAVSVIQEFELEGAG